LGVSVAETGGADRGSKQLKVSIPLESKVGREEAAVHSVVGSRGRDNLALGVVELELKLRRGRVEVRQRSGDSGLLPSEAKVIQVRENQLETPRRAQRG